MSTRVLLAGPLPKPGTVIGGANMLFVESVRCFEAATRIEVDVVDTSRPPNSGPLDKRKKQAQALGRLLRAIARGRRAYDVVVYNSSAWSAFTITPFVWLAARAAGLPLVVRLIGGSLDLMYDASTPARRYLVERTWLRSALIILETKWLASRFGHRSNVRWMPNTRSPKGFRRPEGGACRKFLYLGRIRDNKGIGEAAQASEQMPEGCTLTFIGPPLDAPDLTIFETYPRAVWIGEIAPEDVPKTLVEYDVLVLPSYYPGEGITGVIIEAFHAGLPVIGTHWRSLPEAIEHERSGLLVPPREVQPLADAMIRIATDDALYAQLCRGALERGQFFDADQWHDQFMEWVIEIGNPGQQRDVVPPSAPDRDAMR